MMLCQAYQNTNIETHVFCPDKDSPAKSYANRFTCADYLDENAISSFNKSVDYITYEFENIPKETLEYIKNSKMGVVYSDLIPVTIKAIQEQQANSLSPGHKFKFTNASSRSNSALLELTII